MIYLRCENYRHLIYVTSKFFSVLLYKVKSPWPMKSLQPTLEKDFKKKIKTNKKTEKGEGIFLRNGKRGVYLS